MPNNITLFKKYIDLLDEVYKNAALTADLDGDTTLVRQGNEAELWLQATVSQQGTKQKIVASSHSLSVDHENKDCGFKPQSLGRARKQRLWL